METPAGLDHHVDRHQEVASDGNNEAIPRQAVLNPGRRVKDENIRAPGLWFKLDRRHGDNLRCFVVVVAEAVCVDDRIDDG